jgi:peptide/nickel transport system permease protein
MRSRVLLSAMLVIVPALLAFLVWVTLSGLPNPLEQHLADRLLAPSSGHLLGTDHLGRDLLSRLVHGAWMTIGLAASGIGLAALLGGALGLLGGLSTAGPAGALVRGLLQVQLAFPGHWLAVFLLAVLGNSTPILLLSLVLALWGHFAWVALDETRALEAHDMVLACRALGATDRHILIRHAAPHIVASLRTVAVLDLPVAVSLVATLGFLGLGVRPPTPTWGGMVAEGQRYFPEAWWMLAWPSLALAGVVILVQTSHLFRRSR